MANPYLPSGISRRRQLMAQPRASGRQQFGEMLSGIGGGLLSGRDAARDIPEEDETLKRLLALMGSPSTNVRAERSLSRMLDPYSGLQTGNINFKVGQ
jgi:hypothetical protein